MKLIIEQEIDHQCSRRYKYRKVRDFIPVIIRSRSKRSPCANFVDTLQSLTVKETIRRSLSTFQPVSAGAIMNFQDPSGRCRDVSPFSARGTGSTDRFNYIFDVAPLSRTRRSRADFKIGLDADYMALTRCFLPGR